MRRKWEIPVRVDIVSEADNKYPLSFLRDTVVRGIQHLGQYVICRLDPPGRCSGSLEPRPVFLPRLVFLYDEVGVFELVENVVQIVGKSSAGLALSHFR